MSGLRGRKPGSADKYKNGYDTNPTSNNAGLVLVDKVTPEWFRVLCKKCGKTFGVCRSTARGWFQNKTDCCPDCRARQGPVKPCRGDKRSVTETPPAPVPQPPTWPLYRIDIDMRFFNE